MRMPKTRTPAKQTTNRSLRVARSYVRPAMLLLICLVMCVFRGGNVQVFADTGPSYNCPTGMSQLDCDSLYSGWESWVPDTCSSDTDATAASVAGAGNPTLSLDANQLAIAQTIIGIAKTDNVGQAGAIIGLMVGLDESGLKIYANSSVPISLNNPNQQAVGDNGSSLGVFQQQITEDWSTISSDPTNQAAVYQLMDPAYSAEAFFGSPPGTNVTPELSKGLQNHSGWQTMTPWAAAQAVQASGTPDGSNYKPFENQAEQIVAQYYSAAPAVALPVSFTAAATDISDDTSGATTCATLTSAQCTNTGTTPTPGEEILCAAQAFQGLYYEYGGGHAGRAAFEAACSSPQAKPDNQPTGGPSIDGGQHGNPSPCAVDCSGLVSMAVDSAFNQTYDWTVADITNSPQWQKITNVTTASDMSQAQPGDALTVGTDHVELFVSYTGGTLTTFGAHHTGTEDGDTSPLSPTYYDAIYRYIGPTGGGGVTL